MEKYSKDTICLVNQQVFGDEEEHQIEMEFFDGYAISVNCRYGLTYPMLKHLSKPMKAEVENYTGRELESPFDIALMYAKPFKLPTDARADKEHDFLMSILTERQVEEFERFSEKLEEREYVLVYFDLNTDCGINFYYGGKFFNDVDAAEYFVNKGIIGQDKMLNPHHPSHQYVVDELSIDSNAKIERIYFEKNSEENHEFYYLISRPLDLATDVVLIWNRGGHSKFNQNEVRFFNDSKAAAAYAAKAKAREFAEELESFGITWNMEEIKFFNHLPTLYHSFNVWGNDGYNVHIVHGKYK